MSRPESAKSAAAAERTPSDTSTIEKRGQSTTFGRFLRDVVILGVLLGGGMFFYRRHVVTREEINALAVEARDQLKKNDHVSLAKAEKLFKQILDIDADSGRAHAGLAETYFWQSRLGLPTTGDAERHLAKAIEVRAERPERYAASAYAKIVSGRAAEAEQEIRGLLEKNFGSPTLAHALGWAMAEQGKYVEASRVIKQAMESDFSAVAFRMTMSELAHRHGQELTAIKTLRDVVKDSMNPAHDVARAWLAALLAKNYGSLTEPAKHLEELAAMRKSGGDASPRAEAFTAWAEGELALAMGNAAGAIEKAQAALAKLKDFPPFMELEARARMAKGEVDKGLELYRAIVKVVPLYRGFQFALATHESKRGNDVALALIEELEKGVVETKGPEFEIFRGDHYARKGNIDEAKAAFTRAAELGDDPAILLGLARITFEEEKKKEKKADLERVAEAFSLALDKRPIFPEAHESMAEISLWNYSIDGADGSFKTAETHFKKLNRPIPDMIAFYDRAIRAFGSVNEKKLEAEAKKASGEWTKRKQDFMANILAQ